MHHDAVTLPREPVTHPPLVVKREDGAVEAAADALFVVRPGVEEGAEADAGLPVGGSAVGDRAIVHPVHVGYVRALRASALTLITSPGARQSNVATSRFPL